MSIIGDIGDGTLREGVDSSCATVLTPCTKALTQGCFDSPMGFPEVVVLGIVSRLHRLRGVDLVNVSTPWRTGVLRQGVDIPALIPGGLSTSLRKIPGEAG